MKKNDITTQFTEFLREKYAIKDFFNPTYIIIGSDNHGIGERVLGCYDGIDAKKFIVETGLAQMIKYVCNSYHGLKVAYTNEVGNLCKELGIDGEKLMEIFVQDTKLNISPYYHIPGEAFGGHCLPKDLSVLQKKSKELKIKSPIIDAISKSNDIQKRKDKKEKVSHLQ